jgi:uncharacterized membrane protein
MAHLYWYLRALLGSLLSDDRAQDAFEYLLIIGVVVVGVIVAMTSNEGGLIGTVVNAVCNAVLGLIQDNPEGCPGGIV